MLLIKWQFEFFWIGPLPGCSVFRSMFCSCKRHIRKVEVLQFWDTVAHCCIYVLKDLLDIRKLSLYASSLNSVRITLSHQSPLHTRIQNVCVVYGGSLPIALSYKRNGWKNIITQKFGEELGGGYTTGAAWLQCCREKKKKKKRNSSAHTALCCSNAAIHAAPCTVNGKKTGTFIFIGHRNIIIIFFGIRAKPRIFVCM